MLMLITMLCLAQATDPEAPGTQVDRGKPAAADPVVSARRDAPAVEAPAAPPRLVKPYRFTVSLGFQHWYGGTFGAPIGLYTPGLTLGVVVLPWLELTLQYSLSLVTLAMPDGSSSRVGFATLAVLLRREFGGEGQRVTIAGGPQGGFVHTAGGVREALGASVVARYLINTRTSFAIGPFLDLRAMLYELPESTLPLYRFEDGELRAGHSDAQVQIGVVAAF